MKRRSFLQGAAVAALAGIVPWFAKSAKSDVPFRFLRPPGSAVEDDFLSRCIRCNQCGEACPNNCIRFMGLESGLAAWGTPYIIAREQGCILCMKCGEACPTGVIRPVEDKLEEILKYVKMGHAVVDEAHCLSYQGKTCGVCYRACPLADVAMTIGYLEQPTVTEKCVGCGLCERVCIQLPQAVRIMPTSDRRV